MSVRSPFVRRYHTHCFIDVGASVGVRVDLLAPCMMRWKNEYRGQRVRRVTFRSRNQRVLRVKRAGRVPCLVWLGIGEVDGPHRSMADNTAGKDGHRVRDVDIPDRCALAARVLQLFCLPRSRWKNCAVFGKFRVEREIRTKARRLREVANSGRN